MRIRAFVFDDNESNSSLISTILENRGYEVLSFSEPSICPIYLDRKCPCPKDYACGDLFIANNRMFNMTGLEFIENQTRNGCKGIVKNKAVISTTYTNAEVEKAKKLECQVFEKLSFIDKIDSWLDECEKRIDPNRKLSDLNMFE